MRRPPIADLTPNELKLGLAAVLGFAYALSWLALAGPAVGPASLAPGVASPAPRPDPAAVQARAPSAQPVAAARPPRAKSARIRTRSS
jgi:hypothetical protein